MRKTKALLPKTESAHEFLWQCSPMQELNFLDIFWRVANYIMGECFFQVMDAGKLRALWVSVTGKELRDTASFTPSAAATQPDTLPKGVTEGAVISPREAVVEEARQVPGGPDPLHHSNSPSSP